MARQEINVAKSVLCVGAGPAGVETAGYLKEKHPNKTIGIAMRGNVILKGLNGAHAVAEKELREMGIQIHYNSEVAEGQKLQTNEGADYDYQIDCRGFKYQGPAEFFQNDLKECLDKKSNQILIDKQGRVTSIHPIS